MRKVEEVELRADIASQAQRETRAKEWLVGGKTKWTRDDGRSLRRVSGYISLDPGCRLF